MFYVICYSATCDDVAQFCHNRVFSLLFTQIPNVGYSNNTTYKKMAVFVCFHHHFFCCGTVVNDVIGLSHQR